MISLFCFLKEFNFSIFLFSAKTKGRLSLTQWVHLFVALVLTAKLSPAILDYFDIFVLALEEQNIPKVRILKLKNKKKRIIFKNYISASNVGMDLVGWFRNYSAIRLPSYENFKGNEYPNLHGSCVLVWTFARWLV